jgi:hypothetical protein
MFEFLDKVWLTWTGWDIIQAYIFGVVLAVIVFIIFSILVAMSR